MWAGHGRAPGTGGAQAGTGLRGGSAQSHLAPLAWQLPPAGPPALPAGWDPHPGCQGGGRGVPACSAPSPAGSAAAAPPCLCSASPGTALGGHGERDQDRPHQQKGPGEQQGWHSHRGESADGLAGTATRMGHRQRHHSHKGGTPLGMAQPQGCGTGEDSTAGGWGTGGDGTAPGPGRGAGACPAMGQ